MICILGRSMHRLDVLFTRVRWLRRPQTINFEPGALLCSNTVAARCLQTHYIGVTLPTRPGIDHL
jgi:hypothetical protein